MRSTGAVTPRELVTSRSRVVWSDDGRTVAKYMLVRGGGELFGTSGASFRNETRVNRLLLDDPPPVPIPRLVQVHRGRRLLVFEALHGDPLGPKFPTVLSEGDIAAAITTAQRMELFQPRRRWFRALPVARRLRLHEQTGLITASEASTVAAAVSRRACRWSFAHGDITARNLLRLPAGELALIDWEWAGIHPPLYDLAFLWFSLIDVGGARAAVERQVPEGGATAFLGAAAIIQLLHLQMWEARSDFPREFRERHSRSLRRTLAALHEQPPP